MSRRYRESERQESLRAEVPQPLRAGEFIPLPVSEISSPQEA